MKKALPPRKSIIAKLDRLFANYIKKRDSGGGEYFKCISCGQVKPIKNADCGHYFSRRHIATRWDENNAHCECSYCLTPDSLILTKDLTWKPLGNINVGDKIFSFDEEKGKKLSRHWKEGIVTHIHKEIQDVYEVELENGDIVKTTAEHQWLVRNRGGVRYEWIATKNLWVNGKNIQGKRKSGPNTGSVTSIVCKPILVVEHDKSYESGWLAGMIDADGHLCQQNIFEKDGSVRYGFRIGIAQSETYPQICSEIIRLLEKFSLNNKPCRQYMQENMTSFKQTTKTWQFIVTGTNVEKLHFLMRVRPNKLSKLDINKLGCIRSKYDTKVKSIKHIGKQEIVVMETDTHTFIANGYAMHNCNRFDSEHLHWYRKNLIEKIGEKAFEELELKSQMPIKYSDFELNEMYIHYGQLMKLLEREQKAAEKNYKRLQRKNFF